MSSSQNSHICGLDFFRFVLLFLGMFTHSFAIGQTFVTSRWLFDLPEQTTFMFRMEAFFLISGYLSAFGIKKKGWLIKRIRRLGVPFLFAVLVLNVITAASSPRVYPQGAGIYVLHAWFLACLLIYSCVLQLCAGRIDTLAYRVAGAIKPTVVPIALLGAFIAYEIGVKVLYKYDHSSVAPRTVAEQIFDNTLTYLPYYFLGYCLNTAPRFAESLRDNIAAYIVVSLFFAPCVAIVNYTIADSTSLYTVLRIVLKSCLGLSLSVIILVSALRVKSVPRFVGFLSEGSYTVYLVHVLIINIIYDIFFYANENAYVFAILCSITTPMVGYIFYLLVKQSALLSFLFTGALPNERFRRAPNMQWMRRMGTG